MEASPHLDPGPSVPPSRLGRPARRARKHAAATAIEALAGGPALVVEFGEVSGEGGVLERAARRAKRLYLAATAAVRQGPLVHPRPSEVPPRDPVDSGSAPKPRLQHSGADAPSAPAVPRLRLQTDFPQ